MLRETAQRLAPALESRTATEQHRATVQRQLHEDRQRRHQAAKLRAVRSVTLSGSIRR